MLAPDPQRPTTPWRRTLYGIIFESDTPEGRSFDLLLILSILLSVVVVLLESIEPLRATYGRTLYLLEWVFTLLFTVEYLLRLISVHRPLAYATSFFGIVDLLAIAPTYFSILIPGTQYLLVVRILRLLRIFRILKLTEYLDQGHTLWQALVASRYKITVFLVAVISLVTIFGSLMYAIEGEENGFVDIPTSMYWAIVTLTTVGYGDIAPRTVPGQFIASLIMLLGYGIIAVPTGIVTSELARAGRPNPVTRPCPGCGVEVHDQDAHYCKHCGTPLPSAA